VPSMVRMETASCNEAILPRRGEGRANRGKKSIPLNLRTDEGRAILHEAILGLESIEDATALGALLRHGV